MSTFFSIVIVFLHYLVDHSNGQDVQGVCADKIPDCRSYGQSVCQNFADWSKLNCAVFCGMCVGPTAARECKDYVTNCGSFTSDLCSGASYRVWAEDHCPKFCGFCTVDETQPATVGSTQPATVGSTQPATVGPTQPQSTTTPSTQATTKPTTSKMTTSAIINAPCADAINFCLVYSRRACDDASWADKYCRKWCARC